MAKKEPRFGGWITLAEEVAREHQHREGLDAQTANRMLTVYSNLNPANKKKYAAMSKERAAEVAWKLNI